MPYYSLIEGEGIAGPLHAVTAATTTMYSCMGIVFHNAGSGMAGLFHYPANCLGDVITQNTIIQMINDIVPSDVYVTAPAVANGMGYFGMLGSSLADRNAVDLFLLANAGAIGANIQWMPDRNWSNYRMAANGALLVNSQTGASITRRSIEMATQMPNAVGRNMGGNATFYGGTQPNAPARPYIRDDDSLRSSWRTR